MKLKTDKELTYNNKYEIIYLECSDKLEWGYGNG